MHHVTHLQQYVMNNHSINNTNNIITSPIFNNTKLFCWSFDQCAPETLFCHLKADLSLKTRDTKTIPVNGGNGQGFLLMLSSLLLQKLIFDTHSGNLLLVLRTLDDPSVILHIVFLKDQRGFVNNVLDICISLENGIFISLNWEFGRGIKIVPVFQWGM